jgi:virginiamycin A acetyltransferase
LNGPDPSTKHPMAGFPQVCFIKNTVTNPDIVIGDYTYYDDPEGSENFERNVLYHFPFIGDKLIIGKFCALARGVKFIMNGANHKISGFSTYPFQIFGNGWEVSDVPPYTVVGGNPAQILKKRFSDETVRALLEIAWWDWDIEKVTRNLEKIVAADLAALRAAHSGAE